jgi:hypothetical protein
MDSDDLMRKRPTGFLLSPFGWATERIAALLRQNPILTSDLIHLSCIRMHLIALSLAHRNDEARLAELLFRGSAREILDAVFGCRPGGLKRVFQRLPAKVLEIDSYRRLVTLLGDPEACKLLYHSANIDDGAIRTVTDIPLPLRSVAFTMQAWFRGMQALPDGLRCLVRRGGASSFDDLMADLADIRQPEQMIARVKQIVESLPLPDALPPSHVGYARRLDSPAEIRGLAKRWRNCLADYTWRVDSGDCAIYLWEDAEFQAACLVARRSRLGWFLDDVRGPRNTVVARPYAEVIEQAFDRAGISPSSAITAIEDIVEMSGARLLRRRRRHHLRPTEPIDDPILQDVA